MTKVNPEIKADKKVITEVSLVRAARIPVQSISRKRANAVYI
jgi:hypothetical protein